MNADRVARWMDVVASLAVVVSLVFLIHEVRLNTQEVRRQGAIQQAGALATPFYQSPVLMDALVKVRAVDGEATAQSVFQDAYGMTAEEALLWSRHLSELWRGIEAEYLHGNRPMALRSVEGLLQSRDNRLFLEDFLDCCVTEEFAEVVRARLEAR